MTACIFDFDSTAIANRGTPAAPRVMQKLEWLVIRLLVLAWYYVSWAISAPFQLAELGLPYEKEYELAKKMGE